MTDPDLVRRLTTIMDIDVVGFSTMSARDEEHALALLGARMAVAQGMVKHHRGRVFKLTGDGLLAEFASPVEAVRAALEIQEAMRAANDQAGSADQLVLRIGVNLGDVVESGDDLMGDAVNVAARLESIAKPGGICVSAAVYEQIEGKLTLGAEDLGEQHVKNIPRAIHAYRLTLGGAPVVAASPANRRKTTRLAAIFGAAAAVAVLAIGGAWLVHQQSQVPASTRVAQAPAAASPPAPVASATPPAPPAAPPATAAPVAPPPPVVPAPAATPAPAAAPKTATPQPYVASEVPFVPQWRERRLEDYGQAEDDKALAINVRGWLAMATRMIDETSARRRALEECNALVEREIPVVREFDRCVIYAVGNKVVWPFRLPPMPPPPYLPAVRPSPPIRFDAATVPLVTERGRQNLQEHYMRQTRHRALVLGHGPLEWWSPSENDADAIRRNLQTCGQISGRPCVVYAVDDQVVVRVPQLHRVTGIFTPDHAPSADAGRRAAIERYLVDNDWRALALADNGPVGLVSGRASEAAAVADALAECSKAGGVECKLAAIGPFLVGPK
jgi:class 3 adenylate cyclase